MGQNTSVLGQLCYACRELTSDEAPYEVQVISEFKAKSYNDQATVETQALGGSPDLSWEDGRLWRLLEGSREAPGDLESSYSLIASVDNSLQV